MSVRVEEFTVTAEITPGLAPGPEPSLHRRPSPPPGASAQLPHPTVNHVWLQRDLKLTAMHKICT